MLQRVISLILALGWLSAASAWALDPDRHISQYAHAAWRMQDGVFKGDPYGIAQTPDGYLWLGTTSELLRFDGVRFVPWHQIPPSSIGDLLVARDGSLWLTTDAGVSRWKDQTLTSYPGAIARGLLERRDGTIWTIRGEPPQSLCEIVESGMRCQDLGDVSKAIVKFESLTEDAQGDIWLAGSRGLVRWSHGSLSVYQLPGLKDNLATGVTGLAVTPDGGMWAGVETRGGGLGLQGLVQGRWQTVKTPELDGATLSVTTLHVDRNGALWIGTDNHGIYRLYRDHVDRFDSTQGLSSDFAYRFLDDREGNLWVATSQGV